MQGSERDKRRDAFEKEEKAKKVHVFLSLLQRTTLNVAAMCLGFLEANIFSCSFEC